MAVEILKYSDVEKLDAGALGAKLEQSRTTLFTLRMQKGASGIEKSHELKILKSNIAKLLTKKNAKAKA
ncbi:MAG: 50S ribosomal protein L29 [Halobacteriovoraceae bacterium]|jgi:ribosomal protein L29|nr:50S ribosomal protein L29 [Halobacteriovoraceae bacterium]MBT5095968.1 50S ribosomal protein L29 [Halobacteriovoraceae bacterium]